MKHITNTHPSSYRELWQRIFKEHYRDKYKHDVTGLSGGGGDYPFYDIHLAEPMTIKAKNFALGYSIEKFTVPANYYLRVCNKSTIARTGLDASFNTLIDNGFYGYLTIEMFNYSDIDIRLVRGQPILKVELVECLFKATPYDGKYQNQEKKAVVARF